MEHFHERKANSVGTGGGDGGGDPGGGDGVIFTEASLPARYPGIVHLL